MSDIDELFDNSDEESQYGSEPDSDASDVSEFEDRSDEYDYLKKLKDDFQELEGFLKQKTIEWPNYFKRATQLQIQINELKVDLADDLSSKQKQKRKKKINKYIKNKLLAGVKEVSEHHPDRAEKLNLFREDMIRELENIVEKRISKSTEEKVTKTIPELNFPANGYVKIGRELNNDLDDDNLYFVFKVSKRDSPKLFKDIVKSKLPLSDAFLLDVDGVLTDIDEELFENFSDNSLNFVYKLPLTDSAYESVNKTDLSDNVPQIIKNLQELVITFPDLREIPINIEDINEAASSLERIQGSYTNRTPYSNDKQGNPIFLTLDEYMFKYVEIFKKLMVKKAVKASELDPTISKDVLSDIRTLFADILQKLKNDKDLVNNSQKLEKKLSMLEETFYQEAQEYEERKQRRLEDSEIKELYTIYKKAKSIGVVSKSSGKRKHSDEELDRDFSTGSYSFIMKKYGEYLGYTKDKGVPINASEVLARKNQSSYDIIPYRFNMFEYSINKSAKALDVPNNIFTRTSKNLGLSNQEQKYIMEINKEKSLVRKNKSVVKNILQDMLKGPLKKEFANVLKECAVENDISPYVDLKKGVSKIDYVNNLYANYINIFEFKRPDISFEENSRKFLKEISKNEDIIDEIFGDIDEDPVVNDIGTFYKGQKVTLKTAENVSVKAIEARISELKTMLTRLSFEKNKLENLIVSKSYTFKIEKIVSNLTNIFQEFYGPATRFVVFGKNNKVKFRILIRGSGKEQGKTLTFEQTIKEINKEILFVKNNKKPQFLRKSRDNLNNGTIVDVNDEGLVIILMEMGTVKIVDPEMINPIVKRPKKKLSHSKKVAGMTKKGIPVLQPMFSIKTLFKKEAALRLWASKLVDIKNYSDVPDVPKKRERETINESLENMYEMALYSWYKSLNPKIKTLSDLESMGLVVLEDNVIMEMDTDKILKDAMVLYNKLKNKDNHVEGPPDVSFLKIKRDPTPTDRDFDDSKFEHVPSEYYMKNMNQLLETPEVYGYEYVIPLDKYKNKLYEKLQSQKFKTLCDALQNSKKDSYFTLPNTDEAVLDVYEKVIKPNKTNNNISDVYQEIIHKTAIYVEGPNGIVQAKWEPESVKKGLPKRIPLTTKDLKDLESEPDKFHVPQFRGEKIGPTFKILPSLLTSNDHVVVECFGKMFNIELSKLPGNLGMGWMLSNFATITVDGKKVITSDPIVFTDFDEYLRARRKNLFITFENIKNNDKMNDIAVKKIRKIEKITDYLGDYDYSDIVDKIKGELTPHGILKKELDRSRKNLKKSVSPKITLENDKDFRLKHLEVLFDSMAENSNLDRNILYEKATEIETAIVTLFINDLKIDDSEKRDFYLKKVNELVLAFKYESKIISFLFSGIGSGPNPFVSDKSITVPELIMINFKYTDSLKFLQKKVNSLSELLKWKPTTPVLSSEFKYAKKIQEREIARDKKRSKRVRKDSKEKHPKTWDRFNKLKINVPRSLTSLEILKSLVNTEAIVNYETIETYETISKRDLTLLEKKQLVNDILISRRWAEALKKARFNLDTLKDDEEFFKKRLESSKYDKLSEKKKKKLVKNFVKERKDSTIKFLNDLKLDLENPMNRPKISYVERSNNQENLVKMVKECFPQKDQEANHYSKISELIEDACYNMTETPDEYKKVFSQIFESGVTNKFCQLVNSSEGGSVDLIVNLAELYMSAEENSLKKDLAKASLKTFKTDKKKFFENLLIKCSPTLLTVIQKLDITRSAIDYYDVIEPVEIGQISDDKDSFTEELEKNYFKRVLGNIITAKQREQQILINQAFTGSLNVKTMVDSKDTKQIKELLQNYVHKGLYQKELGFKNVYDNYMKKINDDLKEYQELSNKRLTEEDIESLKTALLDGISVRASLRPLRDLLLKKYPEFSKYVNQQDLLFSEEFVKELEMKLESYNDYKKYEEPVFVEKLPLRLLEKGLNVIPVTGGFLISGSLPANPISYRYRDTDGKVKSKLSELYRKYIKDPLPAVIFRISEEDLSEGSYYQNFAKMAKEGVRPVPSTKNYSEFYYGIKYPENFNIDSGNIEPKEDILFRKIKKVLVENQSVVHIDLNTVKMFKELMYQEGILTNKEQKIKQNISYVEKLLKKNVLKELLLKKKGSKNSKLMDMLMIEARENTTEGLQKITDDLKRSKDKLQNDYKMIMEEFASGSKQEFLMMLNKLCKQLYPKMPVSNMKIATKYGTCVSNAIDFKDVFLGLDIASPDERSVGFPFKSKLNKTAEKKMDFNVHVSKVDGKLRKVILSDEDYPVPVSYLNGKPVFTTSQRKWLDYHLKNGTMSSWLTSRINQLDDFQKPFYIRIGPKESVEQGGTSNYYVELEFSDPVYPRSYTLKVGVPDNKIKKHSYKNPLKEFVSKDEKKRLKYYLKNQERGSRLYQVEAEKEYDVTGQQITDIPSQKSSGAYGLVESRVLAKPIKGNYKVDVWEWIPEPSDRDRWTVEVVKVQKDIQNKLRQYGIQSSAFIDFKNRATHYLEKFRYNLPTEETKRTSHVSKSKKVVQKPKKYSKEILDQWIPHPTVPTRSEMSAREHLMPTVFDEKRMKKMIPTISDDEHYVNAIIRKGLVVIPKLYEKLMKDPSKFKLKDGTKPFKGYYRMDSKEVSSSMTTTKEIGGKSVSVTEHGTGMDMVKVYEISKLELFKNMDKTVDLEFTGPHKKYSKNLKSFKQSKTDKKAIDFIFTIMKNKGLRTVTFFEFLKAVVDFSKQVNKIQYKKGKKVKQNNILFSDFDENSFRIEITLQDILSYMGDSFMQYVPYRYGVETEEIDKPGSFGEYKDKITKTSYLTSKCRYVDSIESSDYKYGEDLLQINLVNEDLHSSESVSDNLARRTALFYETNLDNVIPCFSDEKISSDDKRIVRESDHAIIQKDVLDYLKYGGQKKMSGADERGLILNYRYRQYPERKAITEYTKPYKMALYSLNNKRLESDIESTAEKYNVSTDKLEEYWELVTGEASSKEGRVSFIKDKFWLRPENVDYRFISVKSQIEKEFEKSTKLLDEPMSMSTILDGSSRIIEISDLVKSDK